MRPKDRHVLAAAVRANASGIVTFNIRDFPSEAADIFEIEIIHPDEFLLDQLDLAPATVIRELASQTTANRREPKTTAQVLDALSRAGVPAFADEVRRRLG